MGWDGGSGWFVESIVAFGEGVTKMVEDGEDGEDEMEFLASMIIEWLLFPSYTLSPSPYSVTGITLDA